MERRYECYHCNERPTEEEWNEHNRTAILVLRGVPLPEGVDGGRFDCPCCGEYVAGEDLREV